MLVDWILDEIFDDEWKGRRGEKLTARELKLVSFFGRKGKTLRNIYVPKNNGETSEIDLLYITQKGIFVFESKNYSGWIFGDERGRYWTAMLPNKQKNRFYNPIMQNRTHIKWLRKFVGEDVPLFSIIVFSERCELKKVSVDSQDIKVIKRDRTYATVRSIWEKSVDTLTDDRIDSLYESLKELTNVDAAIKAAHVQRIENKFKAKEDKPVAGKADIKESRQEKEESANPVRQDEAKRLCPKCGSELVLRTARKGSNAGKQFYGCSGFPKCRYTEAFRE